MSDTHDEFECPDCGVLVYSFPPQNPLPTRCATCQWLIDYVSDPDERELMRRRMVQPC